MTREKFVFWVVATLLAFGLLSQGQEWVRASFLAFLMPFPLWLMLPTCSGSSGNSVLPWARGCGCCTALHPLFFFFRMGIFLLREALTQPSFYGTRQRLLKYARLKPMFKKKKPKHQRSPQRTPYTKEWTITLSLVVSQLWVHVLVFSLCLENKICFIYTVFACHFGMRREAASLKGSLT